MYGVVIDIWIWQTWVVEMAATGNNDTSSYSVENQMEQQLEQDENVQGWCKLYVATKSVWHVSTVSLTCVSCQVDTEGERDAIDYNIIFI